MKIRNLCKKQISEKTIFRDSTAQPKIYNNRMRVEALISAPEKRGGAYHIKCEKKF